jgi:ferredoxin
LPEVFGLDDQGVAFVVDANAAPEERVDEVAGQCPAQAILVKGLTK